MTPFGDGDRVVVHLPDGSGCVLHNVRVTHVDGATGAQTVDVDKAVWFAIEAESRTNAFVSHFPQ